MDTTKCASTSEGILTNKFYEMKNSKYLNMESTITDRMKEWKSREPLQDFAQYGILGPSLVWKIFPTQKQALSFAEENPDLSVFSNESSSLGGPGKRSFLVADSSRFFDVYIKRPLKNRAAYEVIKENSPSKLYLDLEFDKNQNPNLDGSRMTTVFINIVKYFFFNQWKFKCSNDEIISLDSSTNKKFSKHIIFNLKNNIFKNNNHVGNVVRAVKSLIENIKMKEKSPVNDVTLKDVQSLYIKDNDEYKLFCDMGVYTKNRNFRLYKATKLGKNTPLVLSDDWNHSKHYYENEKALFLDTLVSTIKLKNKNILVFGEEEQVVNKNLNSRNSMYKNGILIYERSPFEEIDNFISNKVKPGYIRNWKYFTESQTIVYSIENFRYCHNIRREHKSNGILLVTNILKKVWYQKCLDPDCFGFKSDKWPLPDHLFNWLQEFYNEDIHEETYQSNASSLSVQTISDFLNDDDWFENCDNIEENSSDWFAEGLEDVMLVSTQMNEHYPKSNTNENVTISEYNELKNIQSCSLDKNINALSFSTPKKTNGDFVNSNRSPLIKRCKRLVNRIPEAKEYISKNIEEESETKKRKLENNLIGSFDEWEDYEEMSLPF